MGTSPNTQRFSEATDMSGAIAGWLPFMGLPLVLFGVLADQVLGTWMYFPVCAAIAVGVALTFPLRRRRIVVEVAGGTVTMNGVSVDHGQPQGVVCRYNGTESRWLVELATATDEDASNDAIEDPADHEQAWARSIVTRRTTRILTTHRIDLAWRDAVRLARALDCPLVWVSDDELVGLRAGQVETSMLDRLREDPPPEPDGSLPGVEADEDEARLRLRWRAPVSGMWRFAPLWLVFVGVGSTYLLWLAEGGGLLLLSGAVVVCGAAAYYWSTRRSRVEVEVDTRSLRLLRGQLVEIPLSDLQAIGPRNQAADQLTLAYRGGALEVPAPKDATGAIARKLRHRVGRSARALANTEATT